MLTKEEKALAIARAEEWDYAPNNFSHESDMDDLSWYFKDNSPLLIGDLIKLYTSFNGLMPIVAEYNNMGIYEITINSLCIKVVITDPFNKHKPIEKDFEIEDDLVEFSSKSLLDALLDAVYYVLIESKELK